MIIQNIGTHAERRQKVLDMLTMVGLSEEHYFRYPHELSGGQRQRIGIARAVILQPQLLIADEPLSALDVSVQAQVLQLLQQLQEEMGLTVLFIAHDLAVVKYFCHRIGVMQAGKLVELAPSAALFDRPLHPYTQALLSAIPLPDPRAERLRRRIPCPPPQNQQKEPTLQMREIKPEHWVYCSETEYKELMA